MRVLLLQLDGKLPNIALMRIAAHHLDCGDYVELRRAANESALQPMMWDRFDLCYASLIFQTTKPLADRLHEINPRAILGGTGWSLTTTLEGIGITTLRQDYSVYPGFRPSIGYSQRGCRLKCRFCVVPEKEGAVQDVAGVSLLWRGDPWPRQLLLLDNDFFGQPDWQRKVLEIQDGDFEVCLSQGINARFLTDETAAAMAGMRYRDDQFRKPRLYTAWDNRKDEDRLFNGLELLVRYGVKPDQIMVYMLIGYWPGETHDDRDHRRQRLREFGARPYPMPFVRTQELVGFQRWVIGAYDKRISWDKWLKARFHPNNLGSDREYVML